MNSPVLIVEGPGDHMAVPALLRTYMYAHGHYDFDTAPRPLQAGDKDKLSSEGELERYLKYAGRRPDGDSVILFVDCDDGCPLDYARKFYERAVHVSHEIKKPIGLILMKREFETLYLHCLEEIAYSRKIGINENDLPDADRREDKRGAKEAFENYLGIKYREKRDQPAYIVDLSWDKLRRNCRGFRHLERTLIAMREFPSRQGGCVYPPIG